MLKGAVADAEIAFESRYSFLVSGLENGAEAVCAMMVKHARWGGAYFNDASILVRVFASELMGAPLKPTPLVMRMGVLVG